MMIRKTHLLFPLLALLAIWLPAQTNTAPNDSLFSLQWGYNNTGQVPRFDNPNVLVGCNGCDADVVGAWTQTTGSPNVTIAILDGGVEFSHPDFDISRLWVNTGEILGDNIDNDNNGYIDDVRGWDFVDDDNDINDARLAHGAAMYSIVAGTPNNQHGLAGIDWNAKVMILRVADPNGNIDLDQLEDALHYAADEGADIISMSFGFQIGLQPGNNLPNFQVQDRAQLESAINYAYNKGCALFAATGNDDLQVNEYPSAFPNVMAVGAASPCLTRKRGSNSASLSCDNDTREEFDTDIWGSNYGAHVDVLAPGVLLPSADVTGLNTGYSAATGYFISNYNGDFLENFYGTSIAAPFVAGVAGLMLAKNSALTNADLYSILRSTATDIAPAGVDNESGHGMVNAFQAVSNSESCTGIPLNLTVANQNIVAPNIYKATNTIAVGPNVNVTQAVDLGFIATSSITFTADFSMIAGATMEAKLEDPCASLKGNLYPGVNEDASAEESFSVEDIPEYDPWAEGSRLIGVPNPFAEGTMLQFSMANAETVTLQVYNVKGEMVAHLFEGEVQAGQPVEVEFEGGQMPAGIYLARLTTASGKSVTQRLMLQR